MSALKNVSMLALVAIIVTLFSLSDAFATAYYSGTGWLGGNREVRGHYAGSSQDQQTGTVSIQCDLVLAEICFTVTGNWINTITSAPPQGPQDTYYVQPNP
jgi:hypothetical protein